ncbi:MAG: nitroreductase family protein [Oscillospiraceae bacterium]|jgi:nitroreductase/NAD-dependent dihydropyrimidine dehydrogenase PreA subunit
MELEIKKQILHPEGINNGVMVCDTEKCISCGLCVKNCPFKCWELDQECHPRLKQDYRCFSCFNCMVACPQGAISIGSQYSVESGNYFDTGFPELKEPAEAKDASGEPVGWNELERLIFNRRSVRNFSKKEVPKPLIERILEAGRFCPSGGNHQPWKFTVVTNREYIRQLDERLYEFWRSIYHLYTEEEHAMKLLDTEPVGVFDPRVQGGMKSIVSRELPVLFDAPLIIFIACNNKFTDPEIHAGICGQTMSLVAASLGLGSCWCGFSRVINAIPEIKKELGFEGDWQLYAALCIGYPAFKQFGQVPRHARPVRWIT